MEGGKERSFNFHLPLTTANGASFPTLPLSFHLLDCALTICEEMEHLPSGTLGSLIIKRTSRALMSLLLREHRMDSGSQTEFNGGSVNAATVQTVYCSVQFEEYILASVIGIAQCSHVVQNKVKNQARDK